MEAVSCGYYDCWPQTWPDLPSSLIRIGCLGAPYMPLFSVSTNRERFIFYLLTFLIPFFSSHEIKTFWSLTKLWQSVTNLDKATTNPDSVLKSRDITLPTKVCIVKAMVLPVVMDRCESWTIKDAFELWHWRGYLKVPWAARRSNQSILKEINPDYTLTRLMLKLQNFGYLLWSADWLGKKKTKTSNWQRLMAGEERGDRGWDGWITSPTQWTWVWAKSGR